MSNMANGFTQQDWEDVKSFAQHWLECTEWAETWTPRRTSRGGVYFTQTRESVDEVLRKREVAKGITR